MFDYYSIEELRYPKTESMFFPIYPTREDEKKGVLPKYIGKHFLIHLIGETYDDVIGRYLWSYRVVPNKMEWDNVLSQMKSLVCNLVMLYDDVRRKSLAIPSSIISLLNSNLYLNSNCDKLLKITEDLLRHDSPNRHYLRFTSWELKSDGSRKRVPSQDHDELGITWSNYLRSKDRFSSFEDYLSYCDNQSNSTGGGKSPLSGRYTPTPCDDYEDPDRWLDSYEPELGFEPGGPFAD